MTEVDILVADDDDGHVELVRRNLRRAGVVNPIARVDRGDSALEFVRRRLAEGPVASAGLLLLLDIKMPGPIDGIEVLRVLKSEPVTAKVPVIMLTTTNDPREIQRCYELGCNVYVTKPVEPEAFMEAIHRLGLFLSIVRVP